MMLLLFSLLFGVFAEEQMIKPTISTTLPANYQEAKYENEDFPSVSFLKVSDRIRSGRLAAKGKVPEDFEESTYEGENFFDAPKNKNVAKMTEDSSLIETRAIVDKKGLTNSGKPVLRSEDTASWPIADYEEDMPEFLKKHPQPGSRLRRNPKTLLETSSSLVPPAQPGGPPPAAAAGTFQGDHRYLYWTGADTVVPANLHANLPETLTTASRLVGFYSDGTPHAVTEWDYFGEPPKVVPSPAAAL